MASTDDIAFLQWALPQMGYRWQGFRKPRNQVLKRIRERMHQLGLSGGYAEYKLYLEAHPEEWTYLDRLCNVTISKFFRDRKVWDFLRDHVLSSLLQAHRTNPVNIWSIGCCNGEEPYSLAIISEQLAKNNEQFDHRKHVSILATDRNPEVLERAKKGRYPAGSLKELTQDEIDAFFQKTHRTDDEEYKIIDKLKQYITFEQRDIKKSLPDQVFDIILCRNLVFTYFSKEKQRQFLEQLMPHMAAHGFLIIGSNEKLPPSNTLKKVTKTHPIYRKSS